MLLVFPLALSSFLLATRVSTVVGATVIPVIISHTEHEGSHAIGEALGKYPCVVFLEECFERSKYPDEKSHEAAKHAYFNHEGVNVDRVLDALPDGCGRRSGNSDKKRAELKTCQQHNHPILVPILLRGKFAQLLPDLRIFPIVRADLMRHALSSSTEEAAALGVAHPHFKKNISLVRHAFNTSLLRSTVEKILYGREKKVELAKRLVDIGLPCSSLKFIFYEDFLEDQDDFTYRLFKAALGDHFDPSVHQPLDEVGAGVHVKRVHPEDISTFVENTAEVMNFFFMEHFPTFSDTVYDSKIRCSTKEMQLAPL